MRFLLGLSGVSAVLLVAACSGASSNEMFGAEPAPVTEPSPAEPGPAPSGQTEDVPPHVGDAPDAKAPDDVDADTKDASADATKDAAKDSSIDPAKCSFDSECDEGLLCNWKKDVCAAPGPNGSACKRDIECTEGLCNWKLETCSDPASAGTPCRRNKECASGSCGANSLCK